MGTDAPNLTLDLIEDLCRYYREDERSRAIQFEVCEVRLPAPDALVEPKTNANLDQF